MGTIHWCLNTAAFKAFMRMMKIISRLLIGLLFTLANDLGLDLNSFDNLDPLPADNNISCIKKSF